MKISDKSSCTCKNCGCNHHCGTECKNCRNDVCHTCDCEHCNSTKATDQVWNWQDSGI